MTDDLRLQQTTLWAVLTCYSAEWETQGDYCKDRPTALRIFCVRVAFINCDRRFSENEIYNFDTYGGGHDRSV